eukprot:scaffold986_cov23-Tisochrysis_lutea.AAC.1
MKTLFEVHPPVKGTVPTFDAHLQPQSTCHFCFFRFSLSFAFKMQDDVMQGHTSPCHMSLCHVLQEHVLQDHVMQGNVLERSSKVIQGHASQGRVLQGVVLKVMHSLALQRHVLQGRK